MNFQWMNESKLEKDGNKLILTAPPKTDFFCGSISECDEGILPAAMCNAPYYFTEVEGDFVLRVKVSHDFASVYDSCALLVMQDMTCWGKLCYELTDFGAHAVVSVVTKGDSDDANGVNLEFSGRSCPSRVSGAPSASWQPFRMPRPGAWTMRS